jgi:predicted regulator of Ras-like GTPase activity (Roadblock/LC7/MglB family)
MKRIEEILAEVGKIAGVRGALAASTSGTYIAGAPPSSAHLETFTTMSAILLGAAQTATKELNDQLKHVEVKLKTSRILVIPAGDSALLVLEVEDNADLEGILSESRSAAANISRAL